MSSPTKASLLNIVVVVVVVVVCNFMLRRFFGANIGSIERKMSSSSKSVVVAGTEDLMKQKAHGTCDKPVQQGLRYNVDNKLADRICCFTRHYAEHSGYYLETTFEKDMKQAAAAGKEVEFFDAVTGKLLFTAPRGRTMEEFLDESRKHGWPSFRDPEVCWENVRVLPNGETVSLTGTHLGHNLPHNGNRYCINLVSVAGNPENAGL